MDIYQIKYFLAVVDAGNFSRAAERVHVTQPTLSTGIKKLEEELGVALFERNNREVKLTAAGGQFVNRARVIYREMEQAKSEMTIARTQAVLRLGVLKTLPMESVAGLARAFRESHPEVLLELSDGADDDLRARLRTGQIDLALTVLRAEENSNASLALTEETLFLAAGDQHPLAQKASVRLEDVDGQPFIERLNCEIWPGLLVEFQRHGVRPRIVYRAENDQSVMSLIAVEQGLSVMPARPNPHGVRFVPIEDLALKRRVGLVWQEASLSKLAASFQNFVRQNSFGE
ncbi:MAG TPA: LysR family transcriptional regulator [Blastocatellia bacterium]|nr:LysR family transcriptional regulator [Blastocatellia bacterium]HMZ19110.1 LysR family transcriptional regulator [Blastocatellia bacterium]